ncbi:hypothetical protein ABC255_18745 [Neobacillus sp. 3P2-tot-E-2]
MPHAVILRLKENQMEWFITAVVWDMKRKLIINLTAGVQKRA